MNAQSILAQYNTEGLRARLLEFPSMIRAQKDKVAATRQELKEAEQARAERRAVIMAAISAEVNPNTGKAAYSNVEARTAELTRREKEDPECQALCRAIREAEQKANAAQFDLERLADQFKAHRYVADLVARELALLASGASEEIEGARFDSKEPF